METITYYRDSTVQVTSAAIRVAGRAYPLAELGRVWHHRGARSWRALAGRGALGLAMLVPLALAAAGLGLALSVEAAATTTLAIVAGAVLVGLGVGPLADVLLEHLDRSYAQGAHTYEMWADWRGSPVRLLCTRDRLRFGKIYRAAQRAAEQAWAAEQAAAAAPGTGRVRARTGPMPPGTGPARGPFVRAPGR